jgi:hypothetical protein
MMKAIKYQLNEIHEIYAEARSENSWAVTYSGLCLSVNGVWSYEPLPSSRSDDWLAENRFPTPEDAKAAYLKYKHNLKINGKSI